MSSSLWRGQTERERKRDREIYTQKNNRIIAGGFRSRWYSNS